MRIAFDVDGVLNNIEKFQLVYGKEFFKEKYGMDVKNPNGYGIKEIFECTAEQEKEFWEKFTFKFNLSDLARDGAAATINQLKKEGNELFIITSRAKTDENSPKGVVMRFLLEHWLKQNNIGIPKDNIIYCPLKDENGKDISGIEKAKKCKELGIDLMVEDKIENIQALAHETDVICFNNRNNHDAELPEKAVRAYDFDDVYVEVKKYQSRKFPNDVIPGSFDFSTYKELSREEKDNMSADELNKYYENQMQYYLSLPYDEETEKENDKKSRKILQTIQNIFNMVYNPQSLNPEMLPEEDGIILASNHLHSFDPLVIMNDLKGKTFRLLAKDDLKYDAVLGPLFKGINSVFTDTDEEYADKYIRRMSKKTLIKALLHNQNIMMFPEGHRNKTEDVLQTFDYGTVSIARATGKPIYPFAINDNYKVRGDELFMLVGEPIYVNPEDDLLLANLKLRRAIYALLDEIKNKEHEKQL